MHAAARRWKPASPLYQYQFSRAAVCMYAPAGLCIVCRLWQMSEMCTILMCIPTCCVCFVMGTYLCASMMRGARAAPVATTNRWTAASAARAAGTASGHSDRSVVLSACIVRIACAAISFRSLRSAPGWPWAWEEAGVMTMYTTGVTGAMPFVGGVVSSKLWKVVTCWSQARICVHCATVLCRLTTTDQNVQPVTGVC